jgi:hypothetical protein
MNLMGNDFVPHGMALKINDEGIEHVLDVAKGLGPLINDKGNAYISNTLLTLLEALVINEERWLLRGIRRKLEARPSQAKDAVARALAALNDRPVEWGAEKCMVEQRAVEGQEKPAWFFRKAWRNIYRTEASDGLPVGNVVCSYCQALTWTLRYYVGESVDMEWYYPWHLPPLLEDIVAGLRKDPALLELPTIPLGVPLKPVEQLAMVLPASSFHLLPRELQGLPTRFPWAWPTAWPSFSLGRRFLWECEPSIPILRPSQMRGMIGILEEAKK